MLLLASRLTDQAFELDKIRLNPACCKKTGLKREIGDEGWLGRKRYAEHFSS